MDKKGDDATIPSHDDPRTERWTEGECRFCTFTNVGGVEIHGNLDKHSHTWLATEFWTRGLLSERPSAQKVRCCE